MSNICGVRFMVLFAVIFQKYRICVASHENESRILYDIPSAFDYYEGVCRSHCGGAEGLLPQINPCPKCEDKYSHEHCNHCCQGGASSLKLRWNGCGGKLELDVAEKDREVCNITDSDTGDTSTAAFMECACYDSFIASGYIDEGCVLMSHFAVTAGDEICIVTAARDGRGPLLNIDITKSLPNPLILKHKTAGKQNVTHQEQGPDRNDILLTMIDTSCDGENILPLFPGYGKFAGTCPNDGIIDLRENKRLHLAMPIDHYSGLPPREIFFYEFVDGTSVSFWPSARSNKLPESESFFDPTFASCSCVECQSMPPSLSPSLKPTLSPTLNPTSPRPTVELTEKTTIEKVKGCPQATYATCSAFSSASCVSNDSGRQCSYNFNLEKRRKLRSMVSEAEGQINVFNPQFLLEEIIALFDHSDGIANKKTLTQDMSQKRKLKQWAFNTIAALRSNSA